MRTNLLRTLILLSWGLVGFAAEPSRWSGDVPKRIVMIIGENEYSTWETLPEFARRELVPRGYQVSSVLASPTDGDPNFQNFEAIRDADLIVVSVRRRTPPQAMMKLLRAHVAAGKPVVGIRTCGSHRHLHAHLCPHGPAARRELTGPWDVRFPAGWGAPASQTFTALVPLPAVDHPGIKYFSGTAVYHSGNTIPQRCISTHT